MLICKLRGHKGLEELIVNGSATMVCPRCWKEYIVMKKASVHK